MSLKHVVEFASSALWAGILWIRPRGPRRVVLFYHGVAKEQIDSFERQMAHLAARYRVVPASRIRSAPPEDGRGIVALTFDDALLSVFEHAAPVLARYGLPATICAPTGNLGRPPAWNMADGCPEREDCVMTEPQIGRLAASGFEWFSHGVSHAPLSGLAEAEIRREVADSKRRLEEILGCEVVGIGYPHGACDDRVVRCAREAGYRIGLTTVPAFASEAADDLLIGRTSVSAGDGPLTFRLKACGAYGATRCLSRGKRFLLHRFRLRRESGTGSPV
jgi:peptidoglycan/xylan/chitin deacetylase (PgdA/CDA1 family)